MTSTDMRAISFRFDCGKRREIDRALLRARPLVPVQRFVKPNLRLREGKLTKGEMTEAALLLFRTYLDSGLSSESALRSALADCECCFPFTDAAAQ